MDKVRNLPGMLIGLALAVLVLGLAWLAWQGLSQRFGWEWALVALSLSAFARLNLFSMVGTYFYANHMLGWSHAECLGLSAICVIALTPGVFTQVVGTISGLVYPKPLP